MGLMLLHQNLVYVGIKSPPFAPSREGQRDTLYKGSLMSSCVLNLHCGHRGVASNQVEVWDKLANKDEVDKAKDFNK